MSVLQSRYLSQILTFPGGWCWDLECICHVFCSPKIRAEVCSSASVLLLGSEAAQMPDSRGAVGGEAGVIPAECTPVLR